jgi:hypothetical protein
MAVGGQERPERAADAGAPETSALYVRIPRSEAEKLDRAAFELKARKRDLVSALVARYVDPSTGEGLDRLRALAGSAPTHGEVPQPPRRERRAEPIEPSVRISRASEWVAGMQRSVREFAQRRNCAEPLVRVTLDDGEQFFLQAMKSGPGDEFVTFEVYDSGDEDTRTVILRLDAIRKIETLQRPSSGKEKEFVFHPRTSGIGFTSQSS